MGLSSVSGVGSGQGIRAGTIANVWNFLHAGVVDGVFGAVVVAVAPEHAGSGSAERAALLRPPPLQRAPPSVPQQHGVQHVGCGHTHGGTNISVMIHVCAPWRTGRIKNDNLTLQQECCIHCSITVCLYTGKSADVGQRREKPVFPEQLCSHS